MNIALFSDCWFPTKNGVVTVVIQLRRALEKAGHHVVVVTVDSKSVLNLKKPEIDEEDENRLKIPSLVSPLGDNQYIGLPFEKTVQDFCKKHNVEIIHSHTEFTLGHLARVTGRKLGIPVVATTHTMWEDYYRYYLKMGFMIPKGVIRKLVHASFKNFYALINVSQKAHDYFKNPYILPSMPSAIIPNAIDTERFLSRGDATQEEMDELRKSLGIQPDDSVVLYVGRVVEEKRLKELLEICIRVVQDREHVKVLFVGAGGALEEMQKKVQELELTDKIIFAGFVDWFKLSAYYAISSMFVTVSLSEMHSMTVLEAMCLKLPVICRKDTSFTDTIFPGENGYLLDTDEEVAESIKKLVDDKDLCNRMGQKSYELSKHFTLEVHTERTLAFYKAVLKKFPEKITDEELASAVASVKSE